MAGADPVGPPHGRAMDGRAEGADTARPGRADPGAGRPRGRCPAAGGAKRGAGTAGDAAMTTVARWTWERIEALKADAPLVAGAEPAARMAAQAPRLRAGRRARARPPRPR